VALTILNDDFIQIQKSFIVNFKKVNSINSDYVTIGDTQIPIGLQFKKVLLDKMKTSLIPQKV
jgi:DNA-binding LytR/AlgR family response regulator